MNVLNDGGWNGRAPNGRASRSAGQPLALLVHPPVYDFALFDLYLKPYALLHLGHWLDACGYRLRLIDALDFSDPDSLRALGRPKRKSNGTGKFFRQVVDKPRCLEVVDRHYARYGVLPGTLEKWLAKAPPDVVLISSGMSYWYPGVVEVTRLVKKLYPRVPVILGGIYATLCTEHARRTSGADYVVAGDALPDLKKILAKHSLPVSDLELNEDLSLLPDLSWEAGVLRFNRGCPFCCRYCASPGISGGFLRGDPDRVFQTLLRYNRLYGTRTFAFYDDALLVQKEEGIIPFLEKVLSSGLDLSFYLPNALHLAFLDRALALLMKQAGFREIRLGFESAQTAFHQDLDRKLKPDMLAEAMAILKSAGFIDEQISVYILAGLPGQYAEEVEFSIRYAASFGAKVHLAEYSPVPLSDLWDESVRTSVYALAEEPLTHNNTLFPLQWQGFSPEDLEKLKNLAKDLSLKGAC